MIKGSVHQEDRIVIILYVPNIGTPENVKQIQTDLKAAVENTVKAGTSAPHFKQWMSLLDRKSTRKQWT